MDKDTKETKKVKRNKSMEARKKVFCVLVILVVVLAVALILIPLFKKPTVTNKLAEEKTFETYKLKETSISYEEDTTVFETKIENIGSEAIPAGGFNIILLDKEGNTLTSIGVYLKEMEPSEVIETKAVIAEKIENIYDMKIVSDENVTPEELSAEEVDEEVTDEEVTDENSEEITSEEYVENEE